MSWAPTGPDGRFRHSGGRTARRADISDRKSSPKTTTQMRVSCSGPALPLHVPGWGRRIEGVHFMLYFQDAFWPSRLPKKSNSLRSFLWSLHGSHREFRDLFCCDSNQNQIRHRNLQATIGQTQLEQAHISCRFGRCAQND